MLLNKVQLTQSLCVLVEEDSSLLKYIISDYISLIDDKKFDALEAHVNNNINEII